MLIITVFNATCIANVKENVSSISSANLQQTKNTIVTMKELKNISFMLIRYSL